jgi:hypothetical protein
MGAIIGAIVAVAVLAAGVFVAITIEDTKLWGWWEKLKEAEDLFVIFFIVVVVLAIGGLIGWLGTRH